MATLGVVPFSSSHNNKLQILQHSSSSVSNSNVSANTERREILILRKKPKPLVTLSESKDILCDTTAVNTAATTVFVTSNNAGRVRKKPVSGSLPRSHHQPPPVAVARRNARERNRVKQVNNGFATLRQHIPLSVSSAYSSGETTPGSRSSKKLSKVETLRMAVDYIRSLQQLLSMDDNDSNTNIATSHSPNSSDASSPTSLVSPPSPTNSSTNPSQSERHQSYQHYEEDSVQTDIPGSPALIDEDDDTSIIDPTSPSPSNSNFTSQYHRVRSANSFIQLVNAQPDIVTSTDGAHHYEVDETFVPMTVTSTSLSNMYRDGIYITSDGLPAHHLVPTSVDSYSQPPSAQLILGSGTSVVSQHPTSSLSPGEYSEQSLSPETSNIDDLTVLRATSSASFLPSFKSSSPSTLHFVTSSSPLQLVTSSTAVNLNPTSVIQHQNYATNVELLSHVKMENTLGEEEGVSEEVIPAGTSQEVIDIMNWWEQEQRLRLATSVATTTSTST